MHPLVKRPRSTVSVLKANVRAVALYERLPRVSAMMRTVFGMSSLAAAGSTVDVVAILIELWMRSISALSRELVDVAVCGAAACRQMLTAAPHCGRPTVICGCKGTNSTHPMLDRLGGMGRAKDRSSPALIDFWKG